MYGYVELSKTSTKFLNHRVDKPFRYGGACDNQIHKQRLFTIVLTNISATGMYVMINYILGGSSTCFFCQQSLPVYMHVLECMYTSSLRYHFMLQICDTGAHAQRCACTPVRSPTTDIANMWHCKYVTAVSHGHIYTYTHRHIYTYTHIHIDT